MCRALPPLCGVLPADGIGHTRLRGCELYGHYPQRLWRPCSSPLPEPPRRSLPQTHPRPPCLSSSGVRDVVATGAPIAVRGNGAGARQRVRFELGTGSGWGRAGSVVADGRGRFSGRLTPRRQRKLYLLRARTDDGRVSRRLRVRSRDLVLAAVGDVNLGNGPGEVMAQRGFRFPWTAVAPVLRRADIAFGNLECAVSTRGAAVPKLFTFRGPPAALRVMARYAGFDALNLANNHVGDFGLSGDARHRSATSGDSVSRRSAPGAASPPRPSRASCADSACAWRSWASPTSCRRGSSRARDGRAPRPRQCLRSLAACGGRGGERTW